MEQYAAPALLLVTSGAVELVPASNPEAAPVRLPAGQGAGLGGNVVARAADGAEATFVTAIVGPEVPLELAQEATPTPTPTPASLVVQALACPVAYEGTNYIADCAEPLADITFDLNAATGTSGQATTGLLRWPPLRWSSTGSFWRPKRASPSYSGHQIAEGH